MSFRFKKLTISKNDAKHLISIFVPNPETKDKFKLVKSESTSPDKAIQEFSFENRRSPSCAEIGQAVGLAKSSVYRYLTSMDEMGILLHTDALKTQMILKHGA